jgi:hypothetical protein
MNRLEYKKYQTIEGLNYWLVTVYNPKMEIIFSDKTYDLSMIESAARVFNATLPVVAV